jgi:VIT1/CCC1 family predicted Fe2+/Mn2+ transporter
VSSAHGHAGETHEGGVGERANRIRAAVLGANDGIVSVAGLVIGVAGATTDSTVLLLTGLAGLVAGALSMAAGEYVSVSSQRDTESAAVAKEMRELEEDPEGELRELTGLYMKRGLTHELAHEVALQLTAHDALAAHSEVELRIQPGEYVNPWSAALSSMAAFTVGALIPLLAIVLSPESVRIPVTAIAVVVALAITGYLSASLAGSPVIRAVGRNITGGVIAMAITYAVGTLAGNVTGTRV